MVQIVSEKEYSLGALKLEQYGQKENEKLKCLFYSLIVKRYTVLNEEKSH